MAKAEGQADCIIELELLNSEFHRVIEVLTEKATENTYNNDLYLLNVIRKMERGKIHSERRRTGYR